MDEDANQSTLWPALGAGAITLAVTLGGYLAFEDTSSAETVAAANAASNPTSTTPGTSPPAPSPESPGGDGAAGQDTPPSTEPGREEPAPGDSSPTPEPPPSSTAPPTSRANGNGNADPPSDGFASSAGVEWGGFPPGAPEAVVGAFYDAVREDDCQAIVDLWSQSHTDMVGSTRQEQLQTCSQMMDPAMAPPPLEPSDIALVSDDGAAAVVSVTIEINGTPTREEIHLVMESGWKIDLLGAA